VNLSSVITTYSVAVTAYLVLLYTSQLLISGVAAMQLWRYHRRRTPRDRALAARLASPPLVSVVVPARNEALTIVQSVRALLKLDYEAREIVIVNDGSSDDTLPLLQSTFRMVPVPLAFDYALPTARMRGIYRSIDEPGLLVIDKESAGNKSDASNAGINVASGVLVLIIDADTMLEPDSLSRGVLPFLENANTVAVGGYVGISNGSRVRDGRVMDVAMPRSWLARCQIIEYMRGFLMFRMACASANAVTIISGAFGLFRRDALIEVGGFNTSAIGEDMDLTIRLQAHFRARHVPFRIRFLPIPVCWTQAPEDLPSLRAQRYRWRRGLLQVLWRQRHLIGNPRYGIVGMAALPYTALFEGLLPLLEVTGYVTATVAALMGILNWDHYFLLLAVSVLFGASTTLMAVVLNDLASRNNSHKRDLGLLIAAAVVENFGYRQLNSWWGCVGTIQAIRGKGGWGPMKRRAF
jgi:cellulose synthase/poly-beta-1,6-N-acetylglucosamine synthase-like glycosyltransferase